MDVRQRFQAVMHFRPFDRLPLLEWAGWWDLTLERWYEEGLPRELQDHHAIRAHFGLDSYRQDWIGCRRPGCPRPAAHGAGIVSSAADYLAIRHHLYPPPDAALLDRWRAWAREQERGESVLWFTVEGFFWFARSLLGIQQHLFAFFDQPELIHRINSDLADWMVQVIEALGTVCTPDFMTFAEDLSYNNGPMLSEACFEEFLRPYYDRVVPALQAWGTLPLIDSDGDISLAAPWFQRAGLAGILPLERQAGVDIATLRRDHPTLRFVGHFDKMTMSRGEAAMREEFQRLMPTASGGGFLISCDHQTPPEVSYRDYRCYLELFAEHAVCAGSLPGVKYNR